MATLTLSGAMMDTNKLLKEWGYGGRREFGDIAKAASKLAQHPPEIIKNIIGDQCGLSSARLPMRKAPSDLSIFSANNRFPNALAGEAASSTSLSIDQINIALRLPVAIRGALMPDAHKGYSLPIGGVIGRRGRA